VRVCRSHEDRAVESKNRTSHTRPNKPGSVLVAYPPTMIRTVIATTLLLIATTLSAAPQADKVLIRKSARQLTLLRNGKPLRSYHVSLGSHPNGAKEREGDERTPEGLYTIDSRNAYSKIPLGAARLVSERRRSRSCAADGSSTGRRDHDSWHSESMARASPRFCPHRLDGWMYRRF
jgi:hypothetical protein